MATSHLHSSLPPARCCRRLAATVAIGLIVQPAAASATAADESPPFRDATADTGLDFVHFNGMTGRLYYAEVVGSGGALFDFDGDGDLDLYLVQGNLLGADRSLEDALVPWPEEQPLRDRLFRNDLEIGADGERLLRWVDVTAESGIDARLYGMGAAVGDVDQDGDLDLYTLNWGANQLWRNDSVARSPEGGQAVRFVEVAAAAGVADSRWSVAATFSDLDADDRLDLFVVNYLEYSLALNRRCLTERGEPDYCLPSAYQPQADALLIGDGSGSFRDATDRLGRFVPANGLGVVAADWTGDDRQDLYVANDLMANHHWVQPTQVDEAPTKPWLDDALMLGTALNGSGKAEASMGVDTADADGDGDLDLITAHFRRESNTFYRRGEDGFFRDESDPSGLGPPSWRHTGFGVVFLDYDGDGRLDVALANGAVTFVPGADRSRSAFPLDEPNQLYRNRGDGTFDDVSAAAGQVFRGAGVSRAMIRGDLDNDGRVDLVVTNNSGPARVLLNQTLQRTWLGIELFPDPQAMGARVELLGLPKGEPRQLRRVQRDGGYAAAHDARVLFAPTGDGAQSVRVRWPNGLIEEFTGLAVDRYHHLTRGTGRQPAGGASPGDD